MGLPRQEVTAVRQSEGLQAEVGAPIPVTPHMLEDVPHKEPLQLQLAMAVGATAKCALKFVSSMSS